MVIEIFIQTQTKNPAVLKVANASYIIQCVSRTGMVEQKSGGVSLENATEKRAALSALKEALERFSRAAVLKIYVGDPYVRNMLISNMPRRWKENQWRKLKNNEELKHSDLWEKVTQLLSNHAVSYGSIAECMDNKRLKEMEEQLNE